jgi:hypothetical protein
MTTYDLQVINESGVTEKMLIGRLIKSCTVAGEPKPLQPGRDRLITTDTEMYNAAVAFYELHNTNSIYIIDQQQARISWDLRPGDYVLQVFDKDGKHGKKGELADHYRITADKPHFLDWDDRKVFVTQDTKMYENAIKFYKSNAEKAIYTINGDQITWDLRP